MIGLTDGLFTSKNVSSMLPQASTEKPSEDAPIASDSVQPDANFLSLLYQMLVTPAAVPNVSAVDPKSEAAEQDTTEQTVPQGVAQAGIDRTGGNQFTSGEAVHFGTPEPRLGFVMRKPEGATIPSSDRVLMFDDTFVEQLLSNGSGAIDLVDWHKPGSGANMHDELASRGDNAVRLESAAISSGNVKKGVKQAGEGMPFSGLPQIENTIPEELLGVAPKDNSATKDNETHSAAKTAQTYSRLLGGFPIEWDKTTLTISTQSSNHQAKGIETTTALQAIADKFTIAMPQLKMLQLPVNIGDSGIINADDIVSVPKYETQSLSASITRPNAGEENEAPQARSSELSSQLQTNEDSSIARTLVSGTKLIEDDGSTTQSYNGQQEKADTDNASGVKVRTASVALPVEDTKANNTILASASITRPIAGEQKEAAQARNSELSGQLQSNDGSSESVARTFVSGTRLITDDGSTTQSYNGQPEKANADNASGVKVRAASVALPVEDTNAHSTIAEGIPSVQSSSTEKTKQSVNKSGEGLASVEATQKEPVAVQKTSSIQPSAGNEFASTTRQDQSSTGSNDQTQLSETKETQSPDILKTHEQVANQAGAKPELQNEAGKNAIPVNIHSSNQQGKVELGASVVSEPSNRVATHPLPEDFARNLVVKVSEELKAHIEGKTSEVHVVMKPESLGELSLRISMENGKLVATLDVSQPAVKIALEAQLPQLREALASHGIDVKRFDIVSGSDMQFRQSNDGRAMYQRTRSKRPIDVDAAETYDSVKYLGYNTVEYII